MNKVSIMLCCLGLVLLVLVGLVIFQRPSTSVLKNNERAIFTGVAVAGKPLIFTDMACGFPDDAPIGYRVPCNGGAVTVALKSDDDILYLNNLSGAEAEAEDEYWCAAKEILVKGGPTEYETSRCSNGIEIGHTYTVEGNMTNKDGKWYMDVDRLIRT